MARLGRYFIAGQPLHVIQRVNHRGAIEYGDTLRNHLRETQFDQALAASKTPRLAAAQSFARST
jgi:hypothetical protein